jgi:hypothetical protein
MATNMSHTIACGVRRRRRSVRSLEVGDWLMVFSFVEGVVGKTELALLAGPSRPSKTLVCGHGPHAG